MIEWIGKILGYGIGLALAIFIILFILGVIFGFVKLLINFIIRYGWIVVILFLIGLIYNEGEKRSWFNNVVLNTDKFTYHDDNQMEVFDLTEEQELIQQFMQDYSESLVDSINSNDYSIVAPFIKSESALEHAQKKLVNHLYKSGVTEEVDYIEVKEVVQIADSIYQIGSYESIYVTNATSTKLTEYLWKYELEMINGQAQLTNIQEYN